MPVFRLTLLAAQDLGEIGDYTLQVWGRDQATRYLTGLDDMFHALASTQALGRDRSDLRPGLLSCPCAQHVIFFRRGGQENVEILRILHASMDFERHI